jgi:toxin ParE1/3/4
VGTKPGESRREKVRSWSDREAGLGHADEYISRLQEICVLVAGQPGMGVDRQDIAMGVRSFPVDRYVVYYEQHGPVLSVLRVWHTARAPETLSIAE